MSGMSKEKKEYYLDQADKHANFLAEKVFKPAFVMAFIHGVKHGMEDAADEFEQLQIEEMKSELKRLKLKEVKADLKAKLNREHKFRQRKR